MEPPVGVDMPDVVPNRRSPMAVTPVSGRPPSAGANSWTGRWAEAVGVDGVKGAEVVGAAAQGRAEQPACGGGELRDGDGAGGAAGELVVDLESVAVGFDGIKDSSIL